MPKHDPLSAKGISNRMKSIGLQRLRWYCQMCQKQCRDENGFKCHTMSESHLRQMRVFAENPNSILDEFSSEFERGYLETLSHLHGTKRVKANTVYQEYIADKHHIHMNSTTWTSLTGFLMYLGRESKAIVDETEKGWFIQYIDRDPKVLARQAQSEQRQQYELDEEERKKKEIAIQIQQAYSHSNHHDNDNVDDVDNSLVRNNNDEKIAVDLKLNTSSTTVVTLAKKRPLANMLGFSVDDDNDDEIEEKKEPNKMHHSSSLITTQSKTSSLQHKVGNNNSMLMSMMKEEEQKKAMKLSKIHSNQSYNHEATRPIYDTDIKNKISSDTIDNNYHKYQKDVVDSTTTIATQDKSTHPPILSPSVTMNTNREEVKGYQEEISDDHWLHPNIIVKIMNKKIANGELYKEKGIIKGLLRNNKYEAEVLVMNSNNNSHKDKIYVLDQNDLQTVVPKVGQALLIVNGKGKGYKAEMIQINEEKYNCTIRVTDKRSSLYNKELFNIEYEDICKLNTE